MCLREDGRWRKGGGCCLDVFKIEKYIGGIGELARFVFVKNCGVFGVFFFVLVARNEQKGQAIVCWFSFFLSQKKGVKKYFRAH